MTKIKPENAFALATARGLAAGDVNTAVDRAAFSLTDQEWLQIVELLMYDHECNGNPLSKSASDKLTPVIMAIGRSGKADEPQMPSCKFTFDDEVVFDGFSHKSTWNGFDNVAVTKETLDKLVEWAGDAESADQFREITPMENGLYSLGWGFATQIVTDLAKHA